MTTPSLEARLRAKLAYVIGEEAGETIVVSSYPDPDCIEAADLLAALTPIGNGVEPRGCPTPGACSCTPAALTAPIAGMELETTLEERENVASDCVDNEADGIIAYLVNIPWLARFGRDFDRQSARAERAETALKEAKRLLILTHNTAFIDAALSPNPTTKEKS